MARPNLLRSLLALSLCLAPLAGGLLGAAAPAGGAESEPEPRVYTIRVSEKSGFTPGALDDQYAVRVGDFVAFVLDMDNSETRIHSVTFDDTSTCPPAGACWPELRFNDPSQGCEFRGIVLPDTRCFRVRTPGPVRYYDRLHKEKTGVEFQGFIKVAGMVTTTTTQPAPTTTTTLAPTTTTTSRPVTTTTSGQSPTTATTAPTAIRPLLIGSPASTTTTAAPTAGTNPAPTSTTGGKGKDKAKDKDKGDATSTSTTAALAPDVAPIDVSFADSLDLGPVSLPDSVGSPTTADGVELDAAMELLNSDGDLADDDRGALLIAGLAAAGTLLLIGGIVAWGRRSSRYFPA
jgi:hypothetical protein